MEAEVNKMELMFQKADSDPYYIQSRPEDEIRANHPESAGKKNPVTLLKESLAVKSQCQTSHICVKPFAVKQQETKSCVCAAVLKNRTIIQELQKQTDLELSPRTKEKTVAEQLKSQMSEL
ncbi:SKA complex subunit 2-like [Crocuta crocuta]